MNSLLNNVNKLLVEVFNDILKIEENALRNGSFNDVSITEVHTIEAIGMYKKKTMSEIAKRLNITTGTLTVAIKNLVNKGYVERLKTDTDKRIVRIGLTKRGRVLFRIHYKFHTDLVRESLTGISKEESQLLERAFSNLHQFLVNKYLQQSSPATKSGV